jgi:pimeloyl-ACP methyl ester carboxylesterase
MEGGACRAKRLEAASTLRARWSSPLHLSVIACALSLVSATFAADELPRRGSLGLEIDPTKPGLIPKTFLVSRVSPGSLAASLDIRVGDNLVYVNKHLAASRGELSEFARHLPAGQEVTIDISRAGESKVLTGQLPEEPRESYAETDVIYDSVLGAKGQKLRTIITKPKGAAQKLPVIFVVGWLSCDSVEAPNETRDATASVLRMAAQLPGFCTVRMDKQGCGDSEGICAETDFETELAGYRAAFRALAKYDFIDAEQIYLLGISNGGGFAPLVPESQEQQAKIRGYAVTGGWVKTWFEHMLEIERRRFTLSGKSPGEVNDRMKNAATLYHDWLIKGRPVPEIVLERPKLAELWPEGTDVNHLYGRPLAFYQQLQKLNLAAVWSQVKVPTLVMYGQYDWIMSRDDHETIAKLVNANRPGAARFVELPATGHTFQHYLSMADAFAGKEAPFDSAVAQVLTDWFKEIRGGKS